MKDPIKSKEAIESRNRGQVKSVIETIKFLLDKLEPSEREIAINQITEYIRPIPVDKAGALLTYLAKILPTKQEWSVDEIKQAIKQSGLQVETKEIYNAIGYLNRKNHIRRVGYGRYVIDGIEIITSEDLGGENSRNEDGYRIPDD